MVSNVVSIYDKVYVVDCTVYDVTDIPSTTVVSEYKHLFLNLSDAQEFMMKAVDYTYEDKDTGRRFTIFPSWSNDLGLTKL